MPEEYFSRLRESVEKRIKLQNLRDDLDMLIKEHRDFEFVLLDNINKEKFKKKKKSKKCGKNFNKDIQDTVFVS